MRKCAVIFFLGLSLVIGNVQAQGKKRLPVGEAGTKQKIIYFNNLYSGNATKKRINESGDVKALKEYEEVERLFGVATGAFAEGNYTSANANINQAIILFSKISRNLGSSNAQKKRLLKAFQNRKESVEAILEAYDRVSKEKKIGAEGVSKSLQVKAYLEKADSLVGDGKLKNGREELEKAYALVTALTVDLRQGDTLVRELHFDTPKDEFLYEVDRNDSLASVLKMVLNEKKQNPKILPKINTLHAEAEEIRKRADKQADSGDFEGAMKTIIASTKNLIRAVRMAGLFIPG